CFYAFLDDAPLEERRTQAVYTRRADDSGRNGELGILDTAAIEKVAVEAWPQPMNADEVHEALLLTETMTEKELNRLNELNKEEAGRIKMWINELVAQKRAGQFLRLWTFWVAAERLPMLQAIYSETKIEPHLNPPPAELTRN